MAQTILEFSGRFGMCVLFGIIVGNPATPTAFLIYAIISAGWMAIARMLRH